MIEVKLSRILGDKRLSQTELSRRTKIRANTISDLYNDFALSIKLEHLDRICDLLECDITDILQYTPKTKKEKRGAARRIPSDE